MTAREPTWPDVDCIVSNPPFLGGNKIRQGLGDDYVEKLFKVYEGRVPAFADLCCYWFERARTEIEHGRCKRAGLLATQGIRGGANRKVLERIKETGDIFFAESDRPWILDGASVHVSMVGFDDGSQTERVLDSVGVPVINSNLSSNADTPSALALSNNLDIWCYGSQQKGQFDIPTKMALELLSLPNPNARPNSDVLLPSVNAAQVLRRTHESFVIDFALEKDIARAAAYEAPFEFVKKTVYPVRKNHRETIQRRFWWLHARPSPRYRVLTAAFPRYLTTPVVSKHRVFVWMVTPTLVDHRLIVFSRSDDYFFGVLQSRFHEVWALKLGTRLETRPCYTPTTCFETFPFPEPTEAQKAAIGDAAKELNALREAWLNPPEWTKEEILEFPGSTDGPWARFIATPAGHPETGRVDPSGAAASVHQMSGQMTQMVDSKGTLSTLPVGSSQQPIAKSQELSIGTVRYPRLVPKDDACAAQLKKRTLTNLYNQRPAWLALAHQKLDEAVAAAYAWPADLSSDDILEKLLALNLERA